MTYCMSSQCCYGRHYFVSTFLFKDSLATLIIFPFGPEKQRDYSKLRKQTSTSLFELSHRILNINLLHVCKALDSEPTCGTYVVFCCANVCERLCLHLCLWWNRVEGWNGELSDTEVGGKRNGMPAAKGSTQALSVAVNEEESVAVLPRTVVLNKEPPHQIVLFCKTSSELEVKISVRREGI